MIAETIPGIADLSTRQKLILANELWESVEKSESSIPFDDAVEKLLEARLQHYREHPETAMTWDEFKKSIGK